MKRALSLYLPTWPTDGWWRRQGSSAPSPDAPVILSGRERQKQVVKAANQAAQRLGIIVGMNATQAGALVAGLCTEPYDAKSDREALEKLAAWVLRRYSPTVAVDTPDGLLIDSTGCAHLFGGEITMLTQIIGKLQASGIQARAAIAPTYGAAYALARYAAQSITIIHPAELTATIDKLPVKALRIGSEMAQTLAGLGFDTIGELREKPRAPLLLRFGKQLTSILDNVYGHSIEFIDKIEAKDAVIVMRSFAEPISAPQTLQHYIEILATQMCALLEADQLGTRCQDMYFYRVDNSLQIVRVGLAKPMRDAKRLARLFIEKLTTVDPGFGVEIMRLHSVWTEPLTGTQQHMALERAASRDISSLVDTLSNRLGNAQLYKMKAVESDVPERSVIKTDPLNAEKPINWPKHWPRPVRLLSKPEHITTMAMLPDYPPQLFTWRGRRMKVTHADGPERIYGEWWRRDAEIEAVRDYYHLEVENGERYWIFRAGDGVLPGSGSQAWFMHGLFA